MTRNSSSASSSSTSSVGNASASAVPPQMLSSTMKANAISPFLAPYDGDALAEDFLLQLCLILTHDKFSSGFLAPAAQPTTPDNSILIEKLRQEVRAAQMSLAEAQSEIVRLKRQTDDMKALNEQTKTLKEERDELKYEVMSLKLDVDIEKKQKLAAEQKVVDLEKQVQFLTEQSIDAPTPTKSDGFFKRLGNLSVRGFWLTLSEVNQLRLFDSVSSRFGDSYVEAQIKYESAQKLFIETK